MGGCVSGVRLLWGNAGAASRGRRDVECQNVTVRGGGAGHAATSSARRFLAALVISSLAYRLSRWLNNMRLIVEIVAAWPISSRKPRST